MANLKDLIVNGAARIIGKTYSSEFVGNVTGNADTATKVNSSLSIKDAAGNPAITSWDGDTDETLAVGGTSPIAVTATNGKITISHNNSTVSAGTYKSVTVDAKGHVTAGTHPTTLSGYGISDAKIANGVITLGSNTITPLTSASTLAAGKVSGTLATSNIPNLDASKITTGTISVDRLPATALERCVVVADDTARFKLTTSSVQVGDTVKVTATKKMYMVIDSSKLSSEAGYEEYFTSTDWSTITNKPSSYTPSSHTHTKSQITDFPTKMPASDVYDWAKAKTKPSYAWSEITNKPSTFTPATHSHDSATQSANGFMSAADKKKLDGVTESADSVSFSRSLTSGTKVGTITINGTGTDLYAPTNTDTHYKATPVLGASDAVANASTETGNTATYLNIVENGGKSGGIQIKGSGATTVSAINGVLTISSTDNNTTNVSATTTGSGNAVTSVTASGSVITVTKGASFLTAHQDISGKEDKSNKVTSWSATTTDAHYPSEKLVKAALDGKASSSHTHTKSQITDFPSSMPASDVYSWAKAKTKPSYAWGEITDKPSTFTPSTHTHSDATTSAGGFMSSTDKAKLNGIASGAEINQNAFSNVTVGSTTISADSKTDTLTLAAGNNITLTPDAANDKITISSSYVAASASASGIVTTEAQTFAGAKTFSNTTDSTNNTSGAVKISGGLGVAKNIYAAAVHNAVWNDLADCIPVDDECKVEPGYCYCFDGERYYKSTKYLDEGIVGIDSDTYGMNMGRKPDLNQMDVAVAGFVLAYVDKEYKPGTPLTCTENGYLTEIKKEDKIEYPERIVATYWKSEPADEWGSDSRRVRVNGRKWVKVV